MTTRLLIARHGNTFAQSETPRRVGRTDIPLVASGEAQGKALGQHIQEQGWKPIIAFTSELQRTIRMAELVKEVIGADFPCHRLPFLNEIDYGVDENCTEAEVIARIGKEAITRWDAEAIAPDGWHIDVEAIRKSWQTFAQEINTHYVGKTVLVVTSNGIARFAPVLTGDETAFRRDYSLKLATGALGVLEYHSTEQHWTCKGWNLRP